MADPVQRGSGPNSQPGTRRSANQRGAGDTTGPDGKPDILQEALRRADEAWLAERNNVTEGRDCQRFYAGDQWDTKTKADRDKKNRPALTINRLPQFVRQMTGDLRKNPPALKCLPAKGAATAETAEAFNGIIKNIEQQSQAKDCYIKAVENAAQASQGFFRIVTEYSDDDSFDLDIRIRPILDPFGALLDPFAQLFDKSDSRYGFVFEHMTVRDFQLEWPGKSVVDVSGGQDSKSMIFPWRVNETIRIAEYWRRTPVKKMLIMLDDGSTVDDEKLILPGAKEINRREVQSWKVESWLITGADVLSGPHAWPGRYIPICMVVGEEISQEGATVRKGMVHDARDPQRIYNYSRSASVEAVAMQPKAPWTGTVDMFKGRGEWATAGSENHAFLAFNPDPRFPGMRPERAQPALASAGLDQQAMISANDMQAVTGIYNDNLGAPSTQHSGVAINAKKVEGDTGTYLYPDNLARAIGYAGKILVDLIPRVYDTERQVRILKDNGEAKMVMVNRQLPPGLDPNSEEAEPFKPLHDLSAGEYDVVVTTGPSFATQRVEAQANMTEVVRAVPEFLKVAGDIYFKNMDWPGADEIAKRWAKAMGIAQEGEPPPAPPPPNPADVAKAMKDAASADLVAMQAEGQGLENAQMIMQINAMGGQLAQLMALVQGLAQGGAGGPPSQSGGPPPGMLLMPPGGVPAGPAGPPQPQMNGAGMPPMIEIGDEGVAPV